MKQLLLTSLFSLLLFPLFLSAQVIETPGCMNFYSSNYNSEATIDDGSCEISQFTQSEFTFTNCGQEGRYGPDQTQVNNEYALTNLANKVISNDGIQEWIVPFTGNYTIEAMGARGGHSVYGQGALSRGTIFLEESTTLRVLVGQQGGISQSGSGGGGSFVVTNGGTVLVVAGGGGGQYDYNQANNDLTISSQGSIFQNGNDGYCSDGGVHGARVFWRRAIPTRWRCSRRCPPPRGWRG